ncbi:alpha/beta hydrolase [Caballeronia temeraria]|uniref:Alpha/beta hydrolase n=1 Tax=Caballeronia temeraria TaxID=1777137 RepID=A0A158C682_9BURK|nr:alpha/beta hydrolase [Caballeronia temeraria]SAK77416.1 alpha/beta hydrolase [Caballeronia temeraria]
MKRPSFVQRRSVRIRNGRFDISVEDTGESGAPCVLLHGRGECSGVWRTLTESACADHRFVSIDLRGHGDSSWDPERAYDARTLAGDVLEVLFALNIRKPVLIGHSLGGSVALHLTGMLEQFTSGLVLVDFGPYSDGPGSQSVLSEIRETPARFDSIDEYAQWLQERRPLASGRALRNLAAHALRRTSTGGFEPKLDRAVADDSPHDAARDMQLWAMLKSVRCPSLVVRGIGSALLTPQVAWRMAHQALPKGQLATISRAGHSVMTDNPDEFNTTIQTFLASLSPSASGGASCFR